MIYWELFLAFLKIGAFTFGGGYAMISIIRETVTTNGWLTEEELLNFIAVSESTPGPIAINMATFVGSSQGGVIGALMATLGVVLPAFLVILLIATFMRNLLKFAGVQAFLGGIRPCVVALILATAVTMGLKSLLGFTGLGSAIVFHWREWVIFALLVITATVWKKLRKKAMSPIVLIAISAALGIVMFSIV